MALRSRQNAREASSVKISKAAVLAEADKDIFPRGGEKATIKGLDAGLLMPMPISDKETSLKTEPSANSE
jgi:hypothetical protein